MLGEPFARYPNWGACISDQKSRGKSDDSAKRICGYLKARLEFVMEAEKIMTDEQITRKILDLQNSLDKTYSVSKAEAPRQATQAEKEAQLRQEMEREVIRAEIEAWKDALKARIRQRVQIPAELFSRVSSEAELMTEAQIRSKADRLKTQFEKSPERDLEVEAELQAWNEVAKLRAGTLGK